MNIAVAVRSGDPELKLGCVARQRYESCRCDRRLAPPRDELEMPPDLSRLTRRRKDSVSATISDSEPTTLAGIL
jgi:hypothetical protein